MRTRTDKEHEAWRWNKGSPGCEGEQKAESSAGKSTGRSLTFVMDVWIGLAFIVAMAVCAGVEYARNSDLALDKLFVHHILELFLFGFVLWGISWIVLRVVLVAPIQQIFLHLYGIGGGDHTPLAVNTGVREILEIVDGINVMLWRMERRADLKALGHAHRKIADIREHLSGSEGVDHAEIAALLDHVAELEQKLHAAGLPSAIKAAREATGR